MTIFPLDTETDVITGFTDIVAANIGVPVAIFAALFGVGWLLARVNKARKGRL
jgi:hypothetical protein